MDEQKPESGQTADSTGGSPGGGWSPGQPAPYGQSQPPTRRHHFSRGWIPAIVLVILGIVFLVRNAVGGGGLHNWWALFILIPAFGSFATAFTTYRSTGRMTGGVIRSVIWGILFLFLVAVFIFDLPWDKIWPVFLILVGLSLFWRKD
jgi:hypothetical protein